MAERDRKTSPTLQKRVKMNVYYQVDSLSIVIKMEAITFHGITVLRSGTLLLKQLRICAMETVNECCYVGDKLKSSGVCDGAVAARMRIEG